MKNVVIIPTYNERENIARIIPMIFEYVPRISVLVVDDNSPDGTAQEIRNWQSKYSALQLLERPKKNGLGPAYIQAFSRVLADPELETIIMMDADLSHDPKHLPEMIELRKKYDLIIGSRYIPGGKTTGWELYRRILSRGGNLYCKFITGLPFFDCTGGFNAINAETLRRIDLNSINVSGYAFIMHLKYLLNKAGASSVEIPIIFKNRIDGVSKLSNLIVREGILAPWKMRWKE
jgi:dolichol-phosphate mannosyltransferase